MKLSLTALLVILYIFAAGQARVPATTGKVQLEDLRIDSSITGFHLAANFQGTIVYTPNGPSDIKTVNPSAFSFTLAPNMTAKVALDQFEQFVAFSKRLNNTLSDVVKKDTTLQGNPAYYVSYIESNEKTNYKNFVFNAYVIKDNTLIVFASGDLDKGIYIDKFKKTFYSMKL
jgi:hypothetical protein